MLRVVRVSIEQARQAGKEDLCRAACIEETSHEFRIPYNDYLAIAKTKHAPTEPRKVLQVSLTGLGEGRKAICQSCPHIKGFSRLTVSCAMCGCAGKSLNNVSSKCPEGKW